MVSQAQINTFATQYQGAAQQAGNELGVSPDILLAQWGLETAYGTAVSGQNNLGNIQTAGSANNYNSIGDFINSFVSTIQNDFPGAENTTTNTAAYSQALATGVNGSYYGSTPQSQYTSTLVGAENTIKNDASGVYNALSGSNTVTTGASAGSSLALAGSDNGPNPGSSAAATGVGTGNSSPCSGITGFFTFSCYTGILGDIVLIILGLMLLVGAIMIISRGDTVSTVVKTINHGRRRYA